MVVNMREAQVLKGQGLQLFERVIGCEVTLGHPLQ